MLCHLSELDFICKMLIPNSISHSYLKSKVRDFPGGPAVENPGDADSIPARGTKILHAVGQLSPCAATAEPARHN